MALSSWSLSIPSGFHRQLSSRNDIFAKNTPRTTFFFEDLKLEERSSLKTALNRTPLPKTPQLNFHHLGNYDNFRMWL